MSEPKLISPMLDDFVMGEPISEHHGVRCCPAMKKDSDDKYIVKIISIPASQVQLDALLLSGAYSSQAAALSYFKELADGVEEEATVLKKLSRFEGFLPYEACQIVPMENQVGYQVYLLSPYKRSLERHLAKNAMTHLGAVNLGLDLCASMVVCRRAGYLYVDLKPGNIFITEDHEYCVGDLGFVKRDSLKWASLPDKYRSAYTAPEIADAMSALNETIDVYAIGLILYQAFNNGKLPFDGEPPAESFPAPPYADYEMAEIILKACAPDPKDRWQSPLEMGQALVAYMQRNTVNDTPIVPPAAAPTEPEEILPDEEDPIPAEEPEIESEEITEPDEEGESPIVDDLDLSDIKELISDDSAPTDGDADDVTDLSFLDDLISDETAPGEEGIENIEYHELSDETSDILSLADELIAHETPEPAIAPQPIDVPLPPPITEPEEVPEEAENVDSPAEQDDTEESAADASAVEGESSEETEAEAPVPDLRRREKRPTDPKLIKRVATIAGSLLLVLLLLFGAYFFYHHYYVQTIDDLQLQGSEDQLTVIVKTQTDESLLTVVCTDIYGVRQSKSLENGEVTFTDLKPNVLYNVNVTIDGFHALQGDISDSYTTPAQTNIVTFQATAGSEDGSVILSFTVDGQEPEGWSVEYTAEGEEVKSVTFTGHMVTIGDLTVDKEYTFKLRATSPLFIAGMDEIQFVSGSLVYAENLAITGCDENGLSVTWNAPEGVTVEQWQVRCYNDSGYDQTITTGETSALFTGIDPTASYNVDVTASGMSVGTRTFVSENSVTVTNFSADTSTAGKLVLSWEFTGKQPEGGWLLMYKMEGTEQQEVVRTEESKAELSVVVPGETYVFTLQASDGVTVFGGSFTQQLPEAVPFSGYAVTAENMEFKMCKTPEKENWSRSDLKSSDYTTSFAVGEKASFLVYLDRTYNVSYDEIVTMFVIRDETGSIVSTSTSTRAWANMWYKRYCELDIPSLPGEPGNYSMKIYFNGCYAGETDFTIVSAQ